MATENAIERPNFFVLLELDPNAPWDQAVFEDVLRAKRNEWSRQGSWVGQKALIAKQNLGMIDKIKQVMADPQLRQKEAEAARELLDQARQARREAFEKQLAYINRGSGISEEELRQFIEAFKDILSPEEIRRRITVKVRTDSPDVVVVQQLDPTKAKKIADQLQFVKKKTLYDLLDLPQVTATPQLYKAAENLYKVAVDRVPKTADVTAITELAGLAMEIFKTDEMRQRYDESLRQAGLDGLLKHVDDLMARTANRRMEPEQVTLFLEDAQSAGWSREDAMRKLEEHGFQHKWLVSSPGAGSLTPKVKCGKCEYLNNADDKKCTNCGGDLYITCPNCGQRMARSQRACGNCGFEVGNSVLVDKLLERIPLKIKVGDLKQFRDFTASVRNIEEIKNLIATLEETWQPKDPDERSRRIEDIKKQVNNVEEAQREVQRSIAEELEHLIVQKRLYTAREFIDRKGEFIPEQAKVEKRRAIDDGIAQAQSMMKQVRAQNLGPDMQVSKVRKVLQICADYQEAVDMLKTLPISPPRNLQAELRGSSIALWWEASTTPDVDYTIVRKVQVRPASAKDGKLLGSTPGTTYDDTSPIIGRPLYYAVYAGFETAASDQAAVLPEPILITQDVSVVKIQTGTRQVALEWETPPNVHSVVIVRKLRSAPVSLQDGLRLAEKNSQDKQLIDTNLQNGQTYYYGIYAQFKNHKEQLVPATGVIVSAVPEEPPAPVGHLEINSTKNEKGEFEVNISWNYTGKGDVAVLKSEGPLSNIAGKTIPEVDLGNHGDVLHAGPNGAATLDTWDKNGVAYYAPVVIFQSLAYVGNAQRFTCRDNITNVKAQNLGNAIRLTWKWPDDCREVLLSYKTDAYPYHPTSPDDVDPSATTRRIHRVQYENQWGGHYDLQAGEQDYYILLTAILEDNGQRVVPDKSVEITASLQTQQVIHYEIKCSGGKFGLKKKCQLVIYVSNPGKVIPSLRVVYRQGHPAMTKMSGAYLYTTSPINTLGKKESPPIDLPVMNYVSETYATLFLEDDDWKDTVIIQHPSKDKMRLA